MQHNSQSKKFPIIWELEKSADLLLCYDDYSKFKSLSVDSEMMI